MDQRASAIAQRTMNKDFSSWKRAHNSEMNKYCGKGYNEYTAVQSTAKK